MNPNATNSHFHHAPSPPHSASSSTCTNDTAWLAFSLSQADNEKCNATSAFPSSSPSSLFLGPVDTKQVFGDGPKLEDFLGGGGSQQNKKHSAGQEPLGHFSTAAPMYGQEIYESELKSIAASFLSGFGGTALGSPCSIGKRPKLPESPGASEAASQKKNVETFGQRTSIYRGVTRHRWTGRYEAHLWDNSCRREGQSRKGRQVYLGGYDKEEKAARAYDLAALKYWGPTTTTNFPVSNYESELEEMKSMTRQEFVASLRRNSSGFSRGASIYRGVTRHHQHGRWQARIGRVAGNKDLYLGTFSTQEEAAEAYDIAAIKFRGLNAVTNFDISRYDVKSIASCNLPIGGLMPNKSKLPSGNNTISTGGSAGIPERSGDNAPSPHAALTYRSTSSPTVLPMVPVKQDGSDPYWSAFLGFQSNNKALNYGGLAPVAFSHQTEGGYSVELPATVGPNGGTHIGLIINNDGQNGQGSVHGHPLSPSLFPFATPFGLTSNNEGVGSNSSSWIDIAHSFQTGKPNISALQTPIFGME